MTRAALAALRGLAAVAALVLCVRIAIADPDADAQRAFNAAVAREDIAALEELGAARPLTRWSDDAWAEAARLSIKRGDLARARRALEQVIAIGSDAQLVRRARGDLARIEGFAGAAGEWTEVATQHERLLVELRHSADPRQTLEQLERLVREHPGYPRAPMLMVLLANAWERAGEGDRAIAWLREARSAATTHADRLHVAAELVRTLIRTGALDAAEREIAELSRDAGPGLVNSLRKMLGRAKLRRAVRYACWVLLALLVPLAGFALYRSAGSWRAALRRLARPPFEVLFLLPLGGVLVAFALTGNRLIARTVIVIVIAGLVASWGSGAILEGSRPVRLSRAAVHASLAVLAILASVYLAVDHGHVIDFVIETWRRGHERG